MSLGECFYIFLSVLDLRDEKGFFSEAEDSLHCTGRRMLTLRFSLVVCAASPCILFCLCLWVTVLVCIGSSYVRDRRLLRPQELPKYLFERTQRTPVGLWSVWVSCLRLRVALGEEWPFQRQWIFCLGRGIYIEHPAHHLPQPFSLCVRLFSLFSGSNPFFDSF